jgi:hypothetical protein
MITKTIQLVWSKWSVISLFCFVGVIAAGCDHRGVPLARSVPVALARPADPKTVELAIERSLTQRHWTVKEHVGQRYVAELTERDHSVTVAVVYDAQSARIDYVNSSNLMYENGSGGEKIHRNYDRWVKNLANDIKVNVAQAPPPAPAQ